MSTLIISIIDMGFCKKDEYFFTSNLEPFKVDKLAEKNTQQREFWTGDFGTEYIERNKTIETVNELYKEQTGITVEKIFESFFEKIDRDCTIIELGCNVGLNLSVLNKIGFKNLTGLEINKSAFSIAKKNNPNISFINSSIEDFEVTKTFDLVYTAGVLIHINPDTLPLIIKKIDKLSKKYIFGFEYYSDYLEEIKYRNNESTCWKQNFPELIKKFNPSFKTIKQEKFQYKDENICDIAYLLEK